MPCSYRRCSRISEDLHLFPTVEDDSSVRHCRIHPRPTQDRMVKICLTYRWAILYFEYNYDRAPFAIGSGPKTVLRPVVDILMSFVTGDVLKVDTKLCRLDHIHLDSSFWGQRYFTIYTTDTDISNRRKEPLHLDGDTLSVKK